jgi:hypothetical protein
MKARVPWEYTVLWAVARIWLVAAAIWLLVRRHAP